MKSPTKSLLATILLLAPLATVAQPDIDIEKEASADGTIFFDADAAGGSDVPVVSFGSEAFYRITVTNTGDVNLLDVVVQDGLLGVDINLGGLEIGESIVLDASVLPELSLQITEDLDFLFPEFTLENFAEVLAEFPNMPPDVGGVTNIDPAHIRAVAAAISEPMSLALLSLGIAGIACARRKRFG